MRAQRKKKNGQKEINRGELRGEEGWEKTHGSLRPRTSPMGGNVAFSADFAQRRTAFRTEINIMGLNLQGCGLWDAHTYTHTHARTHTH